MSYLENRFRCYFCYYALYHFQNPSFNWSKNQKSYCINSRDPLTPVLESADILENHINLYFLRSQSPLFGIITKLDFYTAGNPSWIRRALDKYLQGSSAFRYSPKTDLISLKISLFAFLQRIPNLFKIKSAITCRQLQRHWPGRVLF